MNGVRRTLAPSGHPRAVRAVPGAGGRRRAMLPAEMDRGFFIVLEGIDGSGKTTQAARLAAWLRDLGREVVETREPTDGPWGRRYRAWARGELEASAAEVLGFFVADRREHVETRVAPALERGDVVVCDRYVASTRAYQAADGVDRALIERHLDSPDLPQPDLTLWLRLPVERAIERMGSSATERYERAGFLARVDAEYARMGLDPIDARGDPDSIQAELRRRVGEQLPLA